MKKILLLLLIAGSVNAQTKTVDLLKDDAGSITVVYQKFMNLEKGDTSYAVFLDFRNEEYKTLVSMEVIGFNNSVKLKDFITDLQAAADQMKTGEKVTMQWTKENYKLVLYDFSKNIYIRQGDGKAYTMLAEKPLLKLISILSKVQYGKDDLND